ncbi:preprotein translocase subunit SecA [Patescibacteria group bacterium]|nr:preprotein translocase subunit SecA [Patescibacteria group bacterium]
MFKFLSKIFDENSRRLDQYQKVVDQINALEDQLKQLSDSELAAQTQKFKAQIAERVESFAEGTPERTAAEKAILDEILPEAFATVRETSRRVLGMRHFDVQLLAGIALHHGTVTEQKTGEGKTLTVTAPLYLNALLGRGAHLVTVNDYLAEVGVGWMGPIYHFLGLKVAVIVHDKAKLYNPDIDSEERGDERLEHFQEIPRKDAYAADLTYGTNNEFGFDYLRDNMVQDLGQMVQRTTDTHHFAIVDEADSILIDEARTPLIISAPDTEPTKKYYDYARMISSLTQDIDFKVDEKLKSVTLTDLGVKRIEQKLGVNNLYEESFDVIHHVEAALKAKTLYHRDKEYIVREDQVIIVDEHTGRLMYGRRYSDGLHQAIEAKENVPIQQESRTLATISLQNYFRMYTKLSGMSGTAVTEAEEFRKIYNMDVLPIPTNVPQVRVDLPDVVYKTAAAKYSAIVREVEEVHGTGRPILIGTRSIEHNEIISRFLKRKNIPHQVLNAKNNEKEAFIIADAGKEGAITVATNIAGRGVDIVLGGAKPELKEFRKKDSKTKKATYDRKAYDKALAEWQKGHDRVVELGGLHIIGSERHESRRIDNQLRGRSGRQGDPGSSQFFVALEDEIMRLFGGAQIAKLMDFMKMDEDQAIEHGMIGNAIQSAQVKVEGFFFDQRKRLVEFDDVMNKQREVIYKRRRRVLEDGQAAIEIAREAEQKRKKDDTEVDPPLKGEILTYIDRDIESIVASRASDSFDDAEIDAIAKEFTKIIPFDDQSQIELKKTIGATVEENPNGAAEAITQRLIEIAHQTYQTREDVVSNPNMRQIEQFVILTTIDEKWMDHLDEMDNLRDGIWLRGDKTTVLSEYKREAFAMFEKLIASIESAIASRVFRVHINDQSQARPVPAQIVTQKQEALSASLTDVVAETQKVEQPAAPTKTKGSVSDLAAAMSKAKAERKPTPGVAHVKIGRNDPCPCGSGLKYKKCGMINSPEHQRYMSRKG